MKAQEFAFTLYEDFSIEKEEYTLYNRTKVQVQALVIQALEDGKSFRVIAFEKGE